MAKKNRVVAGDYAGRKIKIKFYHRICFCRAFHDPVFVDETTVKSYTIMGQETSKSIMDILCRGLIGKILFGPIGLLIGCLTSKNRVITTISLEFNNGDRSMIEVDKKIYKILTRKLYR